MPVIQPPPTDWHPEVIKFLLTGMGAMFAILISLVGTLYWLLRSTDSRQQEQLDVGAEAFSKNAIEIATTKQSIEELHTEIRHMVSERNNLITSLRDITKSDTDSIRTWVKGIEDDLNTITNNQDKMHDINMNLSRDIDSLREWLKRVDKELDEIEFKRMKDHESMITLKDHHETNHGKKVI